jgi:hypothetical protein
MEDSVTFRKLGEHGCVVTARSLGDLAGAMLAGVLAGGLRVGCREFVLDLTAVPPRHGMEHALAELAAPLDAAHADVTVAASASLLPALRATGLDGRWLVERTLVDALGAHAGRPVP